MDIKKFQENWKKEHSVVCPHCGDDITDNSEALQGLITYHGEDGIQEIECGACGKDFYVEEHVDRTWDVGAEKIKNENGFDKIKGFE